MTTKHILPIRRPRATSGAALLALAMIAATANSAIAASAEFTKTDTTTQGNWRGVYGTDGSYVIDNLARYPSYAVATPAGETNKIWEISTSDPRALQKLNKATSRIAAAWLSTSSFTIDVNLTDGNSHQVALYFLDWNSLGRGERVQILDAATGAVLDSRSVAAFSQTPQYLVWTLSGHVSIKIARTSGANAVVSGIFFDSLPGGPVGVSVNPATASLGGGQTTHFAATVSGSTNGAVTWSINPPVGVIANGAYTAPAVIASQQAVTVTAISLADPTKAASATVSLTPVAVTVGPSTVSLGLGSSASFAASVAGSTNTAVTWSVSPAIGTVVNGIYTAPAAINNSQKVTLTVTSVADSTKTATAFIALKPVAITLSPGTASLTVGQSATFTPGVTGNSNTAVNWSLIPALGTIINGVYQAPSSIGSQQTVTVIATSAADSSKLASATVSLIPVVVAVGPGSVNLGVGGAATFNASVSGSSNNAVTWSLNPAVGTIVNGAYTAPTSIANLQTVRVTAASVADPTRTASASITLTPVVITLSPATSSLTDGQSATFASTITGTSNTAVTWSLSPAIGTISNGIYQAPAAIASQQSVTVTATSAADSTKAASATVFLQPVGVTVGPASVSLAGGASAAFAASVIGSRNTAVTWSINPAVGTVANGIYTAPATINSQQVVTLTAASVVDSTKTATASITLVPSVSVVSLPLEMLGANGTTTSASVTIPSGANLSGQLSLWMQIHGLRFDAQASVQLNNSGWMPISTGNVTLLGNAAAYGGIGGGFSTLKMTMNLPAGVVQTGSNTITFRFNQTDGRVSGFRVLAFNVQAADGSLLIPSSVFVNDDPNTWQAPSTNPSDIAAGQSLWHQASLTIPVLTGGTQPILAHCSDYHTQDGRDLKYFNYSNNSIQARSVFHGLTAQQGNQIASYIRSLNVVNPGRPWNPPYQPGPGLDSQPVSNWAAGAGLDAVLDSDSEMVNAIFPGGFQSSVFAATSRLNTRELPLPVQLPDWNQWLPGTHPMDAFGSAFNTSGYNTIYQTLSATLQAGNPAVYAAQRGNFDSWFNAFYGLYQQVGTPIWNNNGALWTPANVDAMYSLSQWGLVKNWELNSQFQLEGMAQNIFGSQADPRSWYSNQPFFVAPHELKMNPGGTPGLRNGSRAAYVYLSYVWYNLQLILNDSNGVYFSQFPVDWPYANGFVKDMGSLVSPQAGIQTMWLIKALQVMQQSGAQSVGSTSGWQPLWSQLSILVTPEWNYEVWTGVDPATRAAIANGIATSWMQQAIQFTPQQFYAGGLTTASAVPVAGGNPYDNVLPDWFWYAIPRILFLGGDTALASQMTQWAQGIWPGANWTADMNATCSSNSNYINCNQ